MLPFGSILIPNIEFMKKATLLRYNFVRQGGFGLPSRSLAGMVFFFFGQQAIKPMHRFPG